MKMYSMRDVQVPFQFVNSVNAMYEQVAYLFVYFLPLFFIFLGRVTNQA